LLWSLNNQRAYLAQFGLTATSMVGVEGLWNWVAGEGGGRTVQDGLDPDCRVLEASLTQCQHNPSSSYEIWQLC